MVVMDCEPELSCILTDLFNMCLKESCFPECGKVSLVVLLFSVIYGSRWFWMGSLQKNIQLMLEFLETPFLVLHFSYYTLMTFLMLPVIIYADATLYSLLWFHLAGLITLVLLMWKCMHLFLGKKSFFEMLGLSFSSKLDRGCYIVSVAKSASKKIGALMRSMKFPSSEVALYVYKSTRWACMEYCCHVWASTSSCYLELWDQLQKRICMKVGRSLAVCPQPLAHRQNVSSLSLFYRYCFVRFSSELVKLVPLPGSWGRSTRYSDRWHYFFVTIPRCYKDVYVNSFFPHTVRPWNSLPIEWFRLTCDLSDFKSRINRHLLTVGSL